MGLGIGRVIKTSNGKEGYEAFRSEPCDIILLDWEMPVMNGLEMTRMIRHANDCPNVYVPIIMISCHTELDRICLARDAGANEFLAKPFSAGSLYSRLRTVMSWNRLFVSSGNYFGPDRRRTEDLDYHGRERRDQD